MERTLIILKPDAVQRGLIGEILGRLERRGLKLVALKQLDHFWMLVRRAAGHDQRTGMIGTVFAVSAVIGVTLFAAWFFFLAGSGPELIGGRG